MSLRMKALLVAVGLAVGVVVLPPGVATAAREIQDVFVTNTPDKPVPVAGTVSVGNLPATQQVAGTVGIDPAANQVSVASSAAAPVVVDDRSEPFQVTQWLFNADCGFFQNVVGPAPGTPFRLEGVTIGQDYGHSDELAVTLWGLVRDPDPDVEHLVALAQATRLNNLHEVENIETDILIHPNTREAASPGQVYAVLAEMCLETIEFHPVWVILTGTTI